MNYSSIRNIPCDDRAGIKRSSSSSSSSSRGPISKGISRPLIHAAAGTRLPRFTATSLVFFSFPSPFLCHRSLVNYVSPAGSRLSRRRQMIIYGSINSFDRSLEISSRDPWIAARGSKNTAFFSFFHFFFFLFFLPDVPPRIFIRRPDSRR